jgi:eukaryotic-like serine/threonine-protein kinase
MPPPGSVPSSAMPPGVYGGSGDGRLRLGERFGRYTIEELLGEGAMGRVYRALDTRLGRKIALKVICTSADDPKAAERTAREARAAAALDHPNAVAIFDVGEIDGTSFIAMELITGYTLGRYVKSSAIAWPQRVRWLVDVASALAAAHQSGIIHRDIKPDNVMIRNDGRAKVLDFGVARRAPGTDGAQPGLSTMGGDGQPIGTPLYMAPEQLRSTPLDARTDQFSWGVLAYELLTGSTPWSGSHLALIARILTEVPAPIRQSHPEIPMEVEQVVMRALAKSPSERFATMDEVIALLEPYVGEAPRAHALLPPEAATGWRPAALLPTLRSGHAPKSSTDEPAQPGPRAPAALTGARRTQPLLGRLRAALDAGEAPRVRWSVVALTASALIIVFAFFALVYRRRLGFSHAAPEPAAAAARVSLSANAPPAGPVEAETPLSRNVEAVAAYRAGISNLRTGAPIRPPFERAVQIDPTFAAAHLELAISGATSDIDESTREHFRKVEELRGKLSERDQALLNAFEPIVLRQPSDWVEASRRLTASAERFPHDAQLWFELALIAQNGNGLEQSNHYLDRVLAEDTGFSAVLAYKGQNLAYLGDFAAARGALETCSRLDPSSLECLSNHASIVAQEGECDALERDARQMIAAGTANWRGYWELAEALASEGRPLATVREALKGRWASLPDATRRQFELTDQIRLALWAGDFAIAEQLARAALADVERNPRRDEHGRPTRLLVQILSETGRAAEAARIALDFVTRQDAWEPNPRAEDLAIGRDVTPFMLATAARGGIISPSEFTQRRAAWVIAWDLRIAPIYKSYVWLHGYASVADTPEDAREAFATLPRYAQIPPFRPHTLAWAGVGPALLLTGKVDEATSWLADATKSCLVLEFPVEHTQTYVWLGRAYEAKHDKPKACAAYRVVLDRWGKARPRSVTADKARERTKLLGCKR